MAFSWTDFLCPSRSHITLLRCYLMNLSRLVPAKAPLPAMESGNRFAERFMVELRPVPVREVELGVGNLPRQETREPFFSARADQEIRIGYPCSIETVCENLLAQRKRIYAKRDDLTQEPS